MSRRFEILPFRARKCSFSLFTSMVTPDNDRWRSSPFRSCCNNRWQHWIDFSRQSLGRPLFPWLLSHVSWPLSRRSAIFPNVYTSMYTHNSFHFSQDGFSFVTSNNISDSFIVEQTIHKIDFFFREICADSRTRRNRASKGPTWKSTFLKSGGILKTWEWQQGKTYPAAGCMQDHCVQRDWLVCSKMTFWCTKKWVSVRHM